MDMSFSVYRRNSLVIPITIKDEDGDPVVITGSDIYFIVNKTIEKTVGDGIVITNGEAGECEVTLSADDTDIQPGYYLCEVLVIDPDGNRWTGLITGFTVLKNISFLIEGV
jgi:hypothetical protein